ncbi:MAG: BamA/TamA family outer membrane protein [Bacteroidota bacterium]
MNKRLLPIGLVAIFLAAVPLSGQEKLKLDPVGMLPAFPSEQSDVLLKKIRFPISGTVRLDQIPPMMERIIGLYENSGYPFASVRLDTVRLIDSILQGKLVINPGDRIEIDSILNRTGYRVSNRLLMRITGIRPGDLYSEEAITAAASRMASTTWMTAKRPAEVGFHDQSASLFLYPEKAASNRFDGWIGLSQGSAGSGSVALAGAIDLELQNIAGQGEDWEVTWKRNQDRSQNLKISMAIPWLAGLPFGFQGTFGLYRQDTSYLNLDWQAAIPYHFTPNHSLNLFYRYRESTILTERSAVTLPGLEPYSVWLTGLSWELNRLDNRINPSKGIWVMAEASTGKKSIADSSGMQQSELYTDISCFQPITGGLSLGIRGQAGYRMAPAMLENESFMLGGVTLLRGFNEDTYRTHAYACGSLELRYLLDKYSHILVLADLAYLKSKSGTGYSMIMPYGLGVGGQLRTAGGIFRIIFAVGQETGQPMNIRNGKIHIGYVGLF